MVIWKRCIIVIFLWYQLFLHLGSEIINSCCVIIVPYFLLWNNILVLNLMLFFFNLFDIVELILKKLVKSFCKIVSS